jgi:ABC-type lipopolysaccharide export system ATPase subunit
LAEPAETLEAHGLVKTYRGKRVVDRIDLTLKRREIVGLLAQRCRKTTTFT